MGQSQSLSTEVEIQAPPDAVRATFFDFPRYKQWCKWTIDPVESGKKASELKANERIKVNLDGMAFSPVVKENSADCFSWEGSLWGVFTGKHQFYFSPSTKNPGGTTAVQVEDFQGPLVFLMAPGWSFRQKTLDNWDAFFEDLKKEAEQSSP
ncbi:hypothetical protein A1O7_09354 [Cladophialophora yegresii CBS 114405]|uniref:Activator of Hsp90 ATPase N-terminal domain-containing protein n=1 Tax=Cladophialophora yegresii CBS 114405 TaxID=1182544 RepID=W9VEG8_9EURO|nr:uncharacterized protein A1O7_09354 [Cladophialophora yegresii CBS 114405]EXJ54017.1 hypothetical protein A1O7_09354 [Cladophialophora yegresii CBS 114405]